DGILYLKVDDQRVKQRQMLIEPLNLVLVVPPTGPGTRRYMYNYINIAETYGGVEKFKLGKESTTAGEKLKIVYHVATYLVDPWSMFPDYFPLGEVATGVNGIGHK